MDPKIQRIIRLMNSHKKTSLPWQRGEKVAQSWYCFREGHWKEADTSLESMSSSSRLEGLTIISWNIDFMRSHPSERMVCALEYLRMHVAAQAHPTVIMLNEMLVSDLKLIQGQDWVQRDYVMTDISNEYWESGYYGTCVLVPSVLHIERVFRVHFDDTAMERDGLFVDLLLAGKCLRLCCTHLESLVADPPKRNNQLSQAAKHMHEVDASILGGDLNAIQPFDRLLHADNGLKDAYLETGGIEDDEAGMTWGQMAATKERQKFGLSRMDKFMFRGALQVTNFETFGMDALLDDAKLANEMMQEDDLEQPWVTDHLAIKVDVRIGDSLTSSL